MAGSRLSLSSARHGLGHPLERVRPRRGSLSAEPYPFRDLHGAIRQLVDAFGPRRVFWGTDLTRMPCTYYECIRLFTEHLPWLKGEDLEWVMGRGVCEWLGWPLGHA